MPGWQDLDFMRWIGQMGPPPAQPPPQPEMPPVPQAQPINWTPPQMPALPQRANPSDMSPEIAATRNAAQNTAWAQGIQAQAMQNQAAAITPMKMQAQQANEQAYAQNTQAYEQQRAEIAKRQALAREDVRRHAQMVVDPSMLFKKAGTWGTIIMGLAMAANGALNPRGPNMAMAVVERAIDRNIDAQKFNIDKMQTSLNAQQKAIDSDIASAKDMFSFAEGKRAVAWELVSQKIKVMAEATSNETARANLLLAQAQADQKAAEASQKAMEAQAEIKGREQVARINSAADIMRAKEEKRQNDIRRNDDLLYNIPSKLKDVESRRMSAEAKGVQAEAAVTRAEKAGNSGPDAPRPVLDKNGDQIGTTYRDNWKYVRDGISNYDKIDDEITTIMSLGGDTTWWERRSDVANLGSEKMHQIKQAYGALISDIRKGEKFGGALTANEQTLITEQVGGEGDTWTTKDYYDRLQAAKRMRDRHHEWFLNQNLIERGAKFKGASTPQQSLEAELGIEAQ